MASSLLDRGSHFGRKKGLNPMNLLKRKHGKMPKKALLRNTMVTFFFLLGAIACSAMFLFISGNRTNAGIVFMLAVMLTARYTDGYVPGIIASFVGVVCVNYVFTYPFMELDFTLDGYPFTFIAMLLISGVTSATMTHLKEQNHKLVEAEKETMRANLLRAISHDLRTPLTGIIGSCSTYLENREHLSENEKTGMVFNINEDAKWLLNMVENLLSVTRIRDGQSLVSKSEEPLEEVAAEAVQRFHKRLPDFPVHVTVPQEFIMVPMDAILIEQVIMNLLENAAYHSQSQEPVTLAVTVSEGYARFTVTDHGNGIPPERLSTLFDGNPPAPNTSADSHKGMGIGLTICKTIISAHGGSIEASNEEQGARFTFTLPLGENTYE